MEADLQSMSAEGAEAPPLSPLKKALNAIFWVWLFCAFLLSFTLIKLPQTRVKNLVQGEIAAALAPYGVSFTVQEANLSILFGPKYQMRGVTLGLPPPQAAIVIDELEIAPSMLQMLQLHPGISISLKQGKGTLSGTAWMKQNLFGIDFLGSALNLKQLGLLQILAHMNGGAVLNGRVQLSGDLQAPTGWTGLTDLKLSGIQLDPQTIGGFNLPALAISEATMDMSINNGKAVARTIKFGKSGNASDDLIASITGDVSLARQIMNSSMNVKTKFRVSDRVKTALPLLDMILQPGKSGDGDYSWQLTGPISGPNTIPTP